MTDPLDAACSLVGRFQYHYGRIEQKIDQAVIKLLDLDHKAGPFVTASVDFARKVTLVQTAAYQQAKNDKDKQFAEKTCNRVFAINDVRKFVIHSSFEPADDGKVQFKRTVAAKGIVKSQDQVWTNKKFCNHYKTMTGLETALDKLIKLIKPVEIIEWSHTVSLSAPGRSGMPIIQGRFVTRL
jgi:hypothetical protein